MSSSFPMVCPGSQNLRTGPVICLHALTGLILCKLLADVLMSVGTAGLHGSCSRRLEVGIWTSLYFHGLLVQKGKGFFICFLPTPKHFPNVTGQALSSLNLQDNGAFGNHHVLHAQLLLRLLSYEVSPTLCRLQAARKGSGVLLKSQLPRWRSDPQGSDQLLNYWGILLPPATAPERYSSARCLMPSPSTLPEWHRDSPQAWASL